jgi:hypothetical protein
MAGKPLSAKSAAVATPASPEIARQELRAIAPMLRAAGDQASNLPDHHSFTGFVLF